MFCSTVKSAKYQLIKHADLSCSGINCQKSLIVFKYRLLWELKIIQKKPAMNHRTEEVEIAGCCWLTAEESRCSVSIHMTCVWPAQSSPELSSLNTLVSAVYICRQKPIIRAENHLENWLSSMPDDDNEEMNIILAGFIPKIDENLSE